MAEGKWIEGLSPEMAVADAAGVVLAARLEVVRHFLPLAAEKPYDDPEYVHQLRVGTRRAAAALRAFADCLPRKHLRAARRSLRRIRRAASEARDADVFLLHLNVSRTLGQTANRSALDFLSGYALSERTAAQALLTEVANQETAAFLEEIAHLPGRAHEPRGDHPPASFGELAAFQLGVLMRQLTAAASANPDDPAALHRVRILGKRVRYALEIFSSCFAPAFRDAIYPVVEHLQELLGGVQDATVGLERLNNIRDRARRMASRTWPRLSKGFDAQIRTLRARLPARRKEFRKWSAHWAQLVSDLKAEIVTSTITVK
jgi:CHAD domain-containing protein